MKLPASECGRDPAASGNGQQAGASAIAAGVVNAGGSVGAPPIELEAIYRRYSSDLVKHARRWGFSPEDAEDLTQDFFLRVEEKDSLTRFDCRKGKFRSFLLTLFQRFLANQFHRLHALRRGGAVTVLPLSVAGESDSALVEGRTPETMAELRWARLLLDHALQTLRKDLARRGKAQHFDAALPRLLHDSAGVSYVRLARQLGLSNAATRMTISRYRERLRVLICRELDGSRHAPDQLKDLFAVFGR